MKDVAEAIGFALIVGFLYLVWPPLALLGSGLLLVVWANIRLEAAAPTDEQTEEGGGPT